MTEPISAHCLTSPSFCSNARKYSVLCCTSHCAKHVTHVKCRFPHPSIPHSTSQGLPYVYSKA